MAVQLFGALQPSPGLSAAQRAFLAALETPQQALWRNELAWHYYRGDMYKWTRQQPPSVQRDRELNGKPRDLAVYFNPVKEIVDVDVAKIFASPVRGAELSAEIDRRLNALWTRSDFLNMLRKYVQGGAAQGTVYLHVLDGLQSTIVARRADELQVIKHPQTGDIIAAQYAVQIVDPLGIEGDPTARTPTYKLDSYLYRFVMTPSEYATFKGNDLWAFSDNPRDGNGNPQAVWRNRLGRVPVIEVLHADDGEGNGISAWEGVKETVDGANVISTFMANTVKQHIDPLVVVYGVKKADVEKTLANGQTSVWYIELPDGVAPPRIELQEWRGNVGEVTQFIDWVKERITDVTPELQLARIQEQANPSGYSVALQSSRLIDHITDLRGTYHPKLVEADRLALWAEDVHAGRFGDDLQRATATLNDETEYRHAISAGPMLPVDTEREVNIASKMLADSAIDRLEYLLRAGYSLPQATVILRRADTEAEQRVAREMGLLETEAEAAALRAGNGAE